MRKTGSKTVFGLGVLLLVALLMWGCTPDSRSAVREGSMNLEKHTDSDAPVIPALDASAPAVFETAYFGLG